jgi:hypoxanthine phosphoribosyltransferase
MLKDKATLYISSQEIQDTCAKLGKQIETDYKGKELLLVCILKGSILFFADLIRNINLPLKVDFVRLSSYGDKTESSGTVRVLKDISHNISGKHVLIVEDILDTGNTLSFFYKHLQASSPASLKICTLLDKPSRRLIKIKSDYTGREIEDKFVVGYGLDFQEKCRNYSDVWYFKT